MTVARLWLVLALVALCATGGLARARDGAEPYATRLEAAQVGTTRELRGRGISLGQARQAAPAVGARPLGHAGFAFSTPSCISMLVKS